MDPNQPQPGDVLLFCVHPSDDMHTFSVVDGIPFRRPNGSSGVATWILLCSRCFLKHSDDPMKAPIGDDYTWGERDHPVVYREKS